MFDLSAPLLFRFSRAQASGSPDLALVSVAAAALIVRQCSRAPGAELPGIR
jgi:hypothetical protein